MVQKIKGKNSKTIVHYSKDDQDTFTYEQDISSKVDQKLSKTFSTMHYWI